MLGSEGSLIERRNERCRIATWRTQLRVTLQFNEDNERTADLPHQPLLFRKPVIARSPIVFVVVVGALR